MKLEYDVFRKLRDMVYTRTGLFFEEKKLYFVEKRIARRARITGCDTAQDYYLYLKYDDQGEEFSRLIDVLTTNETYFFREYPQLQAFADEVLPEVLEEKRQQRSRKLQVWSAGCSTGEEAYTLAMVLAEFFAGRPGWTPRLLATDLHTALLRRASQGVYGGQEVGRIPPHLLLKYFQHRRQAGRDLYQARPSLRAIITFGKLNLMGRHYPRREHLDIIFCRNVLIYFGTEDKQAIVAKLTASLRPGGWLFLGHSESLLAAASPRLACVGPTVYRKR